MRHLVWAVWVCFSALLVVACTDQPSSAEVASETPMVQEVQEEATSTASPESPAEDLRSPLTIALSDGNSVDDLIALAQQEARLRDEFMWECLGEQGFEWFDSSTAMDHLDASYYDDSPIPVITDGTYGIVPSDVGMDWAIENVYKPTIESHAIVGPAAGLSGQALEQFTAKAEECSNQADEEIQIQPVFSSELGDAVAGLDDRIASDHRAVSALGAWSRCMHDAGLAYDTPAAAYSSLRSEFSMLRSSVVTLPDDVRAAIPGLLESDPDEILRLVRETGTLDDRVFELEERERKIASADQACRGPLEQVLLTVQSEHQQAFIEDNPDLIGPENR